MKLSRRRFSLLAGVATAGLAMPRVARAQAKPRVVIVGGGAGGATVARYIAKEQVGAVNVTLIEANAEFTSCFFSNHYIGGYRDFASITHRYDTLVSSYGISLVTGRAVAVDRAAKAVMMHDGARIAYDRLVISPGIDLIYDSVSGYSEAAAELMPHAWKGGAQTKLLKSKLDAVRNGQNILIVPPPNPYRCPPAPYERASIFAHVLTAKGYTDCKIIILDPKEKFAKQALFQEGWQKYYPGMIEWYGPDVHGGIESVDPTAGAVITDLDTFKGALVNVIPAQRAGEIAASAGLADGTGYCPIDPHSMKSQLDKSIYIIGDACIAGDMSKSAFAANSQAKVAAMHIRSELMGSGALPA